MTITKEKVLERSVSSLQTLYAMVVALAVGQAVQSFVRNKSTLSQLLSTQSAPAIAGLLGFLVTLVPFYYGMNRHLDKTYLERGATARHGALLLDFFAFFVEALVLFFISWSIGTGVVTFLLLGILLALDVAWGAVSHLIHYAGEASTLKKGGRVSMWQRSLSEAFWEPAASSPMRPSRGPSLG